MGATAAQAIGGQGEAEACETPLPWEEEYDDDMTTEEDDLLDWEVGQHLWGSDWEDDESFLDSQHSYSGREHGDDADSGWRAATCGATRVMATMSATQVHEKAARRVEMAGPRHEEESTAWEAGYLDMWADMKARAAQEMPAHVAVARMLARSATTLEEAAQAAEAAGTATPSQTGRGVPAAKEEKLIVGGASASTAATTADEERRAARKVAYLTLVADTEARRRARLTDMKQRLPSLAAQLQRLRQDVGCTERPAPTKVHLRATATVDDQLKKAEMLLRLMEANLEPEKGHLMEAEAYLRSARELLEVIETRMAPTEAPPRSPIKAVVGFLRAGEPVEGHHRQDDQQEARVSPAVSGGGDPRGDERAACRDQISTRRPPRGMVWSLRKRAWCPPGEFGGRRGRRRRRHERDAGNAAPRKADEMVPRDGLAVLRTSGEKRVTAERQERPPPKVPGRRSGGETAGTDTGGWPERVETGPPSDGGEITASACGECGRDRDMDKRKQRWRHSDGKAQQEDAARRPEIETSEPTGWKGQWLGETEAAREEPLHAAPKSGEQAGQPQPREASSWVPGEQVPQGGERGSWPGSCRRVQHQADLPRRVGTAVSRKRRLPSGSERWREAKRRPAQRLSCEARMHGFVCLQEVTAEAAQGEQSGCREDVTPTAAEKGESGDESDLLTEDRDRAGLRGSANRGSRGPRGWDPGGLLMGA